MFESVLSLFGYLFLGIAAGFAVSFFLCKLRDTIRYFENWQLVDVDYTTSRHSR